MDRDALRSWIVQSRTALLRAPTWPTSSSPILPGRVANALLQLARFGGTQEGGALRDTHDLTQERGLTRRR